MVYNNNTLCYWNEWWEPDRVGGRQGNSRLGFGEGRGCSILLGCPGWVCLLPLSQPGPLEPRARDCQSLAFRIGRAPSVPLWPFVFCVAGPKDFRFRNENDLCNLRRSPSLLNADVDIVILAVVGIWALSSRHLSQFNRAACVTLWKMTTKMNRIGRVCGSPFGIHIYTYISFPFSISSYTRNDVYIIFVSFFARFSSFFFGHRSKENSKNQFSLLVLNDNIHDRKICLSCSVQLHFLKIGVII